MKTIIIETITETKTIVEYNITTGESKVLETETTVRTSEREKEEIEEKHTIKLNEWKIGSLILGSDSEIRKRIFNDSLIKVKFKGITKADAKVHKTITGRIDRLTKILYAEGGLEIGDTVILKYLKNENTLYVDLVK